MKDGQPVAVMVNVGWTSGCTRDERRGGEAVVAQKKLCAVLPRDGAENMETLDLDC